MIAMIAQRFSYILTKVRNTEDTGSNPVSSVLRTFFKMQENLCAIIAMIAQRFSYILTFIPPLFVFCPKFELSLKFTQRLLVHQNESIPTLVVDRQPYQFSADHRYSTQQKIVKQINLDFYCKHPPHRVCHPRSTSEIPDPSLLREGP